MIKNKVLLAMSGGLDSTVSGLILKDMGFSVTAITFLFYKNESANHFVGQAAKVAENLGIAHIVADVGPQFKKHVSDYLIDEYRNGNTPFPCAVCNPMVKFRQMEEWANYLDIHYMATGHYAKTKTENNYTYFV